MKSRKLTGCILVTVVAIAVAALLVPRLQFGVDIADAEQMVSDSLYREVVNDAFGLGEKLTFSIGYGFLTAGTATFEVYDTVTSGEHLCYELRSRTISNSFFDSFYKVRDTSFSFVDVDGIYSHYFRKALHEGSYNSQRVLEFDYDSLRVFSYRDRDQIDTLRIEPFSQDVLSVLYYLRTQTLVPGETISINSVSGKKTAPLVVKVHRRETIEVEAGKFKTILVEPLMTSSGLFKHDGSIKVWLTDDRLKMPVLMKSKIVIGSIHAELQSYELGDLDW